MNRVRYPAELKAKAVKSKQYLAKSIAPLLSLPVQRVIVAHEEFIDDQAAENLAEAFSWLR